jgi:hypothetical protein
MLLKDLIDRAGFDDAQVLLSLMISLSDRSAELQVMHAQ